MTTAVLWNSGFGAQRADSSVGKECPLKKLLAKAKF